MHRLVREANFYFELVNSLRPRAAVRDGQGLLARDAEVKRTVHGALSRDWFHQVLFGRHRSTKKTTALLASLASKPHLRSVLQRGPAAGTLTADPVTLAVVSEV